MTDTFDFAEAFARMKRVFRRMNPYRDGELAATITVQTLFNCTFTEHTPTVSGKEAIAAFIDDSELIVRCVDWNQPSRLFVSNGRIVRTNSDDSGEVTFKDLKQGEWTVSKREEG